MTQKAQKSKTGKVLTVTYLTNACGEDTGYGTLNLKKSDFAKVAFEEGPGCVLPYIGQIGNKKYLIGNLEVAYQDDFWGEESERFDSEEVVLAYCKAACEDIRLRLTDGALLLPLDQGDPGRIIIQVAIPMKRLVDGEATKNTLRQIFGRFCELPDLDAVAI